MTEIRYYTDVEEFISTLQKPARTKVTESLDLLEEFGEDLMMPHCKKIKKNLFELRIGGKQKVRIFYTFYKGAIFLLHGFVKKTTRIPERELDVTLQRLKEFDSI